ncbi:dTDP-4-dehydrorhamnose reductase [Candidatus Uhrbacteria bacterium]|nr:dTDP-4-dehydrorhamnose reductase [Candidatus Uhrbacteria bacterium]
MGAHTVILGAKGMLGVELVRVFSDSEVLAWDREQLDITNGEDVVRRIVEARPTLIINAAAYNAVDKAEEEPDVANRVNGDAVGYLAKAAEDCGATFVHYSSDYVFDGEKSDGYREDDTPNPISAYGRSKFLGEQKMQNAECRMQNYYLIRTSRLFGKEGGGKKSFVDTMLALAQTKDRLEIVDEEFASPTYAADLAEQTRKVIDSKQPSGIYHITNSGVCTWYNFAQEIFAQAPHTKVPIVQPVPSSKFPRPARRPAFSQLLNTKLPLLRTWQEALRAYLESIQK